MILKISHTPKSIALHSEYLIFKTIMAYLLLMLFTLGIVGCSKSENIATLAAGSNRYPLIDWSQLSPANWDAMALLKGIDLSKMQDSDPRAFELLKNVREQSKNIRKNHLRL